jgi:hypothetical protein
LSKIIKLPDEKTKNAEPVNSAQLRQVFTSFLLVAFIFSVVFYATQVEKQSSYLIAGSPDASLESSRSIASNTDPGAEFDWEKQIRNQLTALDTSQSGTSLGQVADRSNELKSKLHGYSTVIFEKDKLVLFESGADHDFQAHPVISLSDLCKIYKTELSISFDRCSSTEFRNDNEQFVELVDKDSQVVGFISYTWVPSQKIRAEIRAK